MSRARSAPQTNFTFLLATFASSSFFLDLGTTSAFYTFVSRRRQPPAFFLLYFAWTFGLQLSGTVIAIAFLLPPSAIRELWLGQSKPLVLLALGSSFAVTQAWGTVAQLGEAARKTVVVQAAATAQALAHLAIVLLLVSFDAITVKAVLWLQLVEFTALALAFGPWLLRLNVDATPVEDETGARWSEGSSSIADRSRCLDWCRAATRSRIDGCCGVRRIGAAG